MTDELRRCPNCDAYVMGHDTRCPRCDFDLRDVTEVSDTAASEPAKTEIFETPLRADDRAPAAERDATPDPVPTELFDGAELLDVHIKELDPALEADEDQDEQDAPLIGEEPVAHDDRAAETETGLEIAPDGGDPDSDDDSYERDEPEPDDSGTVDDAHDAPDRDEYTDLDSGPDSDLARAEASSADESGDEPDEESEADEDSEGNEVAEVKPTPRPVKRTPPPIAPMFVQQQITPPSERVPSHQADMHATRPGTEQDLPPDASTPSSDAQHAEIAEMPTQALDQDKPADAPLDLHATQPHAHDDHFILPPAPYTPPPVAAPPPPASIAPPSTPSYIPPDQRYAQPVQHAMSSGDAAIAYLQQRVQAYRHGSYRIETHGQYEASLTYGKHLSVGTWILALLTVIGAFWYLLVLAVSGFRSDVVYVVLENDGRVYEDGPGAAHIRGKRSRTGRRWSAFGLIVFFLSVIVGVILTVIAGLVLTQDRYQAALREAYPAVTLFEDHFNAERADPGDVDLAKDAAVAFSIVAVLTAVGLWGGATLFVIGTVHASAYRTRVPPLPGWA